MTVYRNLYRVGTRMTTRIRPIHIIIIHKYLSTYKSMIIILHNYKHMCKLHYYPQIVESMHM